MSWQQLVVDSDNARERTEFGAEGRMGSICSLQQSLVTLARLFSALAHGWPRANQALALGCGCSLEPGEG